jgi:tRNA(Ile2) C34 agmatinyltransferase TiaS
MIDGSECPACGGRVTSPNGTDYECQGCGESYDVADLFLP